MTRLDDVIEDAGKEGYRFLKFYGEAVIGRNTKVNLDNMRALLDQFSSGYDWRTFGFFRKLYETANEINAAIDTIQVTNINQPVTDKLYNQSLNQLKKPLRFLYPYLL